MSRKPLSESSDLYATSAPTEVLRSAEAMPVGERYLLRGELARGGMDVVYYDAVHCERACM